MRVVVTALANSQFDELPTYVKDRVRRVFVRLARWPDISGAKPLRGSRAGQFRVRTGDYRVQFQIERDCILVTRVGHRDGFYDD